MFKRFYYFICERTNAREKYIYIVYTYTINANILYENGNYKISVSKHGIKILKSMKCFKILYGSKYKCTYYCAISFI